MQLRGETTGARTVTLSEAATQLGIGLSLAYDLAHDGDFPVRLIRLGRRYRCSQADLDALLGATVAQP